MNSRLLPLLIAVLSLTVFSVGDAKAVVLASDDATSTDYQTGGWTTGDNGGTGFGPWEVYNAIADAIPESTEVDTSPYDESNNLGTPAFKLATGGIAGNFYIERPFTAAMQPGQTFSMTVDSYALDAPGEPGRDLGIGLMSGESTRFQLYGYVGKYGGVTYGTDNFGINAPTANNNLAGGASLPEDPLSGIQWQTNYTATDGSDGFTFIFDVVTADTYRFRVIDDSVTKLDISGQMGGTAGGGITGFYIFGDDYSDFFPPDEQLYGEMFFSDLKIEEAETTLDGDFEGDGDVDGRDFLLWQRNTSVGSLTAWQNNFGAPGLASFVSVPEPSSLGLSALAIMSWLGLGSRKRYC